jgi:hypothetical protein
MKVEFSLQIFENATKFDENPSDADRVSCGRIDGQTVRWTNTTKLVVAFRRFANTPEGCVSFTISSRT